ncbi:MAG: major facilitator superfamily transporter [Frankiales bacterium]|nr:major facilitator superfamily transporter [Frankiales bacterium]
MTKAVGRAQPSGSAGAVRTYKGIGLRSERGPILLAIMLSVGLVALDSTIIATAVPSVVSDLGGFSQFPWLFSIYLLTQAVSVPLYGKFSDMIGRKPVMLFGIGLFLLGSVLCGVAWNMLSLILFRGLQGLGAGAVQPISLTMVGDLYTVEERAKVQGYIAGVWAAASVLGPALGGLFSQYVSWRWIFFINLPLGAFAAWTLIRKFREQVSHRPHRIDYLGAVTLTTGCSLLIVGLLQGGVTWGWGSPTSVLIFAVGAVAIVAFVLAERKAVEPILPLWVFQRRVLIGGSLVSLGVGAITIGLSSYVPTLAQGVLGTGPLVAGFSLASLTIAWPLTASFAGRVYTRIGFRNTALIGTAVAVLGAWLWVMVPERSHLYQVAGCCFVIGLGMGFVASPTLIAVQSVVGWERRGVVTGANMFFRAGGSALGAALFGAIANAELGRRFAHPPSNLRSQLPASADGTTLVLRRSSDRHSEVSEYIRHSLYLATHEVFWGLLLLTIAMFVAVWLIPRRTATLTFD